MIKEQEAIHLEYVANQALDPQTSDFRAVGSQPLPRPDQDIMSQSFQLDQDLLGFEAFLVAFAGGQTLFIFLDSDLDATAAQVVEVDIRQRLPVCNRQSAARHLWETGSRG